MYNVIIHFDIHVVAAIKVAQNYYISVGFKNVFKKVNKLIQNPVMNVNGLLYNLEFSLCSDYRVIKKQGIAHIHYFIMYLLLTLTNLLLSYN